MYVRSIEFWIWIWFWICIGGGPANSQLYEKERRKQTIGTSGVFFHKILNTVSYLDLLSDPDLVLDPDPHGFWLS
jgi:hypothetical protein